MDFNFSTSTKEFREVARQFSAQHVTPAIVEDAYRSGTKHSWELHRAIAERGWIAGSWSEADGGSGMDPFDMIVLLEELHRARAPLDGWSITMTAASAVLLFGSEELRAEVLPAVLAGDALISLGLTEPNAGSDLASVGTRAVRDDADWVLTGQKMFTTNAHEARWVLVLARTDTESAPHRGLSVFIVGTDSEGFSFSPVRTLGGERTNLTFYDGVRLPDMFRVGGVNDGWRVVMTALNLERGTALGAAPAFQGELGNVVRDVCAYIGGASRQSEPDPTKLERLGQMVVDHEVARLLNYRSTALMDRSESIEVEASMAKLFTTEALQRASSDALDMLGPSGLLQEGIDGAPAEGWLDRAFRHAIVTTIYGGSSEILRNNVARRRLQLHGR